MSVNGFIRKDANRISDVVKAVEASPLGRRVGGVIPTKLIPMASYALLISQEQPFLRIALLRSIS